ncbi:MAG: pilus assembly protein TadB [Alphaproteobacteria bacterium]|nr:MAG: pilus assembly protein TadB [Alphaproteobacteria bacterium]
MNMPLLVLMLIVLLSLAGGLLLLLALLPSAAERRVKGRIAAFRARYGESGLPASGRRSAIIRQRVQASALEELAGRLMPRPDEMRRRLRRTGREIALSRYLLAMLLVALVVFVALRFLFGLDVVIAALTAVALGLGLPHMFISRLILRRREAFLAQFPEAIDLMVRGLKSGLPVGEALQIVGEELGDPVGTEFRRIVDQIRLGKSLEEALWAATRRLDFADFQFFVVALAIQRETGGNLAETLANLSQILRQRQQMKLKVKALSSEGRASAMIVGALPFIMFAIIYAMNPDYAGTFFRDQRATSVLVGGLVWMGLGILIIRRMIRFEI